MQKRKNFFPVFTLFLVIAILLFVFSKIGILNGFIGVLERASVPLQSLTFGIIHNSSKNDTSEIAKIKDENIKLTGQLVKQKEMERENQALRDQFRISNPTPQKLLPSQIISMMPGGIIIDKGQADSLRVGSVAIFKDNLIGKVVKLSQHKAIIELITSKNISLTAKTVNSGALGILKGSDDGMVMGNVVLSEKLQVGDIVSTKGVVGSDFGDFPPDLIVGKIISVNKKASSLFQSAEVKSLVDVIRLDMVFIIVN